MQKTQWTKWKRNETFGCSYSCAHRETYSTKMKISNQKSKFSSQESRKGKTNAEQQEEENNESCNWPLKLLSESDNCHLCFYHWPKQVPCTHLITKEAKKYNLPHIQKENGMGILGTILMTITMVPFGRAQCYLCVQVALNWDQEKWFSHL